jgi:hypothetical protein
VYNTEQFHSPFLPCTSKLLASPANVSSPFNHAHTLARSTQEKKEKKKKKKKKKKTQAPICKTQRDQ